MTVHNIVGRVAMKKDHSHSLWLSKDAVHRSNNWPVYSFLMATPVWSGENSEGEHTQKLLGVLMVANKIEEDEASAALDQIFHLVWRM